MPLHCPSAPNVQNPTARLELHEAREGGVYVKGLNTFVVKSEAEIAAVLEVGGNETGCRAPGWHRLVCSNCPRLALPRASQVGKRNRSVGATLMNQDSSRSHSVFTITIEAAAAAGSGSGNGSIRVRGLARPVAHHTWHARS